MFTLICRKGYLLSGGRDGIIHCWNLKTNLEAAGFLQVHLQLVVDLATINEL